MSEAADERDVEVILLGDLNIDLHLDVPTYPAPGGDGVARSQRMGFGGSAANTSVMLSRLGVSAGLVACVGDDEWGSQAITGLAAEGVDVRFVQRSAIESTSLNVIAVTPDGERTMFAYRGASAYLSADVLPVDMARASHLHVSGYALLSDPQRTAAVTAVSRARRAGMTVSVDVPVDPVASVPELLRDFLGSVDVVVIGAKEARRLTGAEDDDAAGEHMAAYGPSVVALTRGAAGSLVRTRDGVFDAPVPAVLVIDTTGAGDSYCAGLILGLLRRRAIGTSAAALANACGAAAVSVVGAGADLPQQEGVRETVRHLSEPLRDEVTSMIGARERSRT